MESKLAFVPARACHIAHLKDRLREAEAERDELIAFAKEVLEWAERCAAVGISTWHLDAARTVLSKYPKP